MALIKIATEFLNHTQLKKCLTEDLEITFEELAYDPSDNLMIYRVKGWSLPEEDIWIDLIYHHLPGYDSNLVTWKKTGATAY